MDLDLTLVVICAVERSYVTIYIQLGVMSLYKARDWWTATCGSDDEFEARSVVIGTIEDNASKPETARSLCDNAQ